MENFISNLQETSKFLFLRIPPLVLQTLLLAEAPFAAVSAAVLGQLQLRISVFRISAGESPEPKCRYLQSATRTERNEIRSIVYIYFLKIVSYICSTIPSCFFPIFAVFHVLVADKNIRLWISVVCNGIKYFM